MKVAQAAQAAARIAVVNDKAQAALTSALSSWFVAKFVKGMKLQLLKDIYNGGAFPAFAELLSERPQSDRLAVVKKVDQHLPDLMSKSAADLLSHLEALARGSVQPTGKPKPPRPIKPTKQSQRKAGIVSSSNY